MSKLDELHEKYIQQASYRIFEDFLMAGFKEDRSETNIQTVMRLHGQWRKAVAEVEALTAQNAALTDELEFRRAYAAQMAEINNVDITSNDHLALAALLDNVRDVNYEAFESQSEYSEGTIALLRNHIAFLDTDKPQNLTAALIAVVATGQNDLIEELCDTIQEKFDEPPLLVAAIKTALHSNNGEALEKICAHSGKTRNAIDVYANYAAERGLTLEKSTLQIKEVVSALMNVRIDAHAREFTAPAPSPA